MTDDPTTNALTTEPLTTKSLTAGPLTAEPLTTGSLTTGALTAGSLTAGSLTTESSGVVLTTDPLTAESLTSRGVVLAGDLAVPGPVSLAELSSLPQHHRPGVIRCSRTGPRTHEFDGPSLLDVARRGAPRFDPAVRKERVRYLIVAYGRDGHHAVFSWAELDPAYGGNLALLALRCDGSPLASRGPQIVIPSDTASGRYVSSVTHLWIGTPHNLP